MKYFIASIFLANLSQLLANTGYLNNGHDFAQNCSFCHISVDPPIIDSESVSELCFSCHDKFKTTFPTYGEKRTGHPTFRHPTFIKKDQIKFSKIYPAELEKNKDFTCASCHDPHNINKRELLFRYSYDRDKGYCSACHLRIY